MPSSRELKTKIGTVRNIRQITRAMQMVAATKMRRAQESALSARAYAKKALSLLNNVLQYSQTEGISGVYWQAEKTNTVALVVVTSDKGLAGSFNSGVLRLAERWKIAKEKEGKTVHIVAVGKKGRDFFKTRDASIVAEFFQFSDIVTLQEITPLIDWVTAACEERAYEEIVFCSTQFVSALLQKPEVLRVFPLDKQELEKIIENIVPKTGKYADFARQSSESEGGLDESLAYVLEPSSADILERVVQDLVKTMVLHLLFESNASEHSARMMAMKNATESAEELIENLNLALNKSRQAAITQELTEIATAKEALTSE